MVGHCHVSQLNTKLYLQLLDVEYQQPVMDEHSVLTVFDRAINSDLTLDERVAFSQRKLEFLEDFGSDVNKFVYPVPPSKKTEPLFCNMLSFC